MSRGTALACLCAGLVLATGLAASHADPPGPFGIGSCYVNNRSVQDNGRWAPQMAAIGLTACRTPHSDWGALEVQPGEWKWDALDAQMAYLEGLGFRMGCTLIGNPRWNAADPPGHLPVHNLAGWSNYVAQLARHVGGRARWLEVWNEPPNFTGRDQTPADYAQIVAAASRAAKAVDPAFRIGLAAKSAHVNYLEQVIRAGARDHFDFIVLHPYEVLDGLADNAGTEAVFLHIVPAVRRMLRTWNPGRVDVPVIFTELGVDARKGLDAQADTLLKAYTLALAQGVRCVHWFEGRDGDSGPMGLLDAQGAPRPAYHALASLVRHLGPRPTYLGWMRPAGHTMAFAFAGAAGPVLVMWGEPGPTAEIPFSTPVRLVDPRTGAVGDARDCALAVSPVFLLDPPGDLLEAARKNRDEPLDWGGDYRGAREVSITFGDPVIERGLHTRSGARVAEAVLAYGGPARAGDVPGGNAFIVDPGFLCYDAAPIEVTVEVRRNPENENAGFKLVYESQEGFKTAGTWYTVPDNTKWHTATWRIDDPQFVNYWGYNFRLESDGPKYSRYLIRRAAVRRLDR